MKNIAFTVFNDSTALHKIDISNLFYPIGNFIRQSEINQTITYSKKLVAQKKFCFIKCSYLNNFFINQIQHPNYFKKQCFQLSQLSNEIKQKNHNSIQCCRCLYKINKLLQKKYPKCHVTAVQKIIIVNNIKNKKKQIVLQT